MLRPFRATSPACLALFLALLPGAALKAEVMVLSNAGGGTGDRGALLLLNTETGRRTLLSNVGHPIYGPIGADPRRVIASPDGNLLVVDSWVKLLFKVDAATGQRTIVSDFTDSGQGPTGADLFGLAIEASGSILVTDSESSLIIRVDPVTGQRTLLSDFANPAQGSDWVTNPRDLAWDGEGRLMVLANSGDSVILIVDPVTGNRSIFSSMSNPSQGEPTQLSSVITANTRIFAASGSSKKIYRVDPASGNRTAVADFEDPAHGTVTNFRPVTLAVDPNGLLQVAGYDSFTGVSKVYSVDPQSGDRVLLSDLSLPEQGAMASQVIGITPLASLFADGFESGDTGGWSSASGL